MSCFGVFLSSSLQCVSYLFCVVQCVDCHRSLYVGSGIRVCKSCYTLMHEHCALAWEQEEPGGGQGHLDESVVPPKDISELLTRQVWIPCLWFHHSENSGRESTSFFTLTMSLYDHVSVMVSCHVSYGAMSCVMPWHAMTRSSCNRVRRNLKRCTSLLFSVLLLLHRKQVAYH